MNASLGSVAAVLVVRQRRQQRRPADIGGRQFTGAAAIRRRWRHPGGGCCGRLLLPADATVIRLRDRRCWRQLGGAVAAAPRIRLIGIATVAVAAFRQSALSAAYSNNFFVLYSF